MAEIESAWHSDKSRQFTRIYIQSSYFFFNFHKINFMTFLDMKLLFFDFHNFKIMLKIFIWAFNARKMVFYLTVGLCSISDFTV